MFGSRRTSSSAVDERIWAAEQKVAWIRIGGASVATIHRLWFGPLPGYHDGFVVAIAPLA